MYQINVNQKFSFKTSMQQNEIFVDEEHIQLDLRVVGEDSFHLIIDNKTYSAEILDVNYVEKQLKIKVNGSVYDVVVKDKYDELLKNLGLDKLMQQRIAEIKAPMPGLVLKILVEENTEVKKGDNLLILEAMKMENIIKAPSDLTVNKVLIKAGQTVEKNQVLISIK